MKEASSDACADALLHGWISRHGICSVCTSDNGSEFVSEVWKKMQAKLGIQMNYTSLYSPQTNGPIERQHSTLKTSLKAAMIQMGDTYQDKWYDYLPWILLMKRISFQEELGTSPAVLCYGTNLAVPGDLLRDPGEPLSEPEIKELVKYMGKQNAKLPHPTHKPEQTLVPEPPATVTHVYTKQHNVTGLQAPYTGPFPVVDRPTRSTVKIKVGESITGQPRYEIQNWRDLKIGHLAQDAPEASRPKRGRPSKPVTGQADTSNSTDESEAASAKINKPVAPPTRSVNTELNARENSNNLRRSSRATRNPAPLYVDSVSFPVTTGPPPELGFPLDRSKLYWSPSQNELEELNRQIASRCA